MPASERERLRKAQDFRSAQSAQSCQDRGKKSVGHSLKRFENKTVGSVPGASLSLAFRSKRDRSLQHRSKRICSRLAIYRRSASSTIMSQVRSPMAKIRLSPRSQLQRLKATNSQPGRLLLLCVRFLGLLRRMSKPQRSITNDKPLIQG